MNHKELPRFIEAWLTLAWVDIKISIVPYAYWRNELKEGVQATSAGNNFAEGSHTTRNPANCTLGVLSRADIPRLIAISESAGRHHWRKMNCLRRCLAQKKILKRRNLSAELHIGVTKSGGKLNAHSWLSHDGSVINDSGDVVSCYTELKNAPAISIGTLLK